MSSKKVTIDLTAYTEEELAELRSNKDSFLMFYDWQEGFSMMSDTAAGQLIKAIYAFEVDGEELPIVKKFSNEQKIMFSIVSKTLVRQKDKYVGRVITNRENGKKGGRPSKENDQDPEQDSKIFDQLRKEFPDLTTNELIQIAVKRGHMTN